MPEKLTGRVRTFRSRRFLFKPKNWRVFVRFNAVVLLLPVILARSRFQFVVAVGESMLPTIKSGQVLLVDRRAYRSAQPQRGDIVVARYKGGLIVKRVVGLPGDEVEVKRGVFYLDGVPSPENHAVFPGPLDVARGKLLAGDFATLGDNRAVPTALAIHPIVTKPEILGRVVTVFGQRLYWAANPIP